MDELYAHYERELVDLRRLCREYAERYPRIAGRLQLGADACDDPHVERLIQSVALLCARVSKRLDDTYPQFTEALLNLLLPHYLKPFPACAIARFAGGSEMRVARGTLLESAPVRNVRCVFRTTQDVVLEPDLEVEASFSDYPDVPPNIRVPDGAASCISLRVRCPRPLRGKLRLYLDGAAAFCAALRDSLLGQVAMACIETGPRSWRALAANPITPVGFDPDDALLPRDPRSQEAHLLLLEYFAFPEKFNFIDLDLPAEWDKELTLHLLLTGAAAGSDRARMLHGLGPGSLVAGCTPVINLFRRSAVPVSYSGYAAEYEILADAARPSGYEVYSVDQAMLLERREHGLQSVECHPFYSLRHGTGAPAPNWTLRRDETRAATAPGHEAMLALVDPEGVPRPSSAASISLELTCTNRDLPSQLRIGAPEGDLFLPGGGEGTPIRLLRRPTRSHRIANNNGTHWRLISQLALDHQSLVGNGPDGLREALALYDPLRTGASQRQLDGIVGLDHRRVARWIRHEHGASLLFGTAVRLTIEPDAFTGTSLHLFAEVIDAFLGLSVQLNSFVELSIVSASGEELIQCKPRNGNLHLL